MSHEDSKADPKEDSNKRSSTDSETVTFDRVCQEELQRVTERRRLLHLSEDTGKDLFGVSLSGGGLRSAYFSLGVIHALFVKRLWRHVDYLSTVSGGGYIGSWLSSRVVRNRPKVGPRVTPLDEDFAGVDPPVVKLFAGKGRYLLRPLQLVNKYLIGLLFVNLLAVSGLVAVAALVAFVWRCLDYPFVRDRLEVLGVRGDTVTPFLPFLMCGALWLLCWTISYWRRGAEAPGLYAKRLLLLTLASLGIGFAILFGNGDIALMDGESVAMSNSWLTPVVGLLGAGLLPLLHPKRLLQSGLRPGRWWERLVFSVVTALMLLGVPLLLIGFLARENISGFNTDAHRRMVMADIEDPLAFSTWLRTEQQVHQVFDGGDRAESADGPSPPNDAQPDSDGGAVGAQLVAMKTEVGKDVAPGELADEAGQLARAAEKVQFIKFEEKMQEIGTAGFLEELASSKPVIELAETLWDAERESQEAYQLFAGPIEPKEVEQEWEGANRWGRASFRIYSYLGSGGQISAANIDRNDVAKYWAVKTYSNELVSALGLVVDLHLLPNRDFLVESVSRWKKRFTEPVTEQTEGTSRWRLTTEIASTAASKFEESLANKHRRLVATKLRQAEIRDPGGISDSKEAFPTLSLAEVKELNRLLLEDLRPDIFRDRHKIRRRVSIYKDQHARLGWMAVAIVCFVVSARYVDFNVTTMHGYYRNRLARAFLNPVNTSNEYPMYPTISELRTTEYGAPYHLICACARNDQHDEDMDLDMSSGADREPPLSQFVFSQLFCGSHTTGFISTDQYERYIPR